jgi:peptidoglycan/LPS O-acetylase OafA/YrhL
MSGDRTAGPRLDGGATAYGDTAVGRSAGPRPDGGASTSAYGDGRLDGVRTAYGDTAVRAPYRPRVGGAVRDVRIGTAPPPPAPTPAPAPVPAAPAAGGRLDFLDGIRALAALFVVVHHMYLAVYAGFPENNGPAFLAPLLYGHFGVAVFIVVSGFSLGLAPAKRGWQLGQGGYWTFMRRRAWRIIPPYWAALAVSVAAVAVMGIRTHEAVSWKGVATHFLLVQDLVEGRTPNGAFWSIAVEWQLYWIFPLLLLLRRLWGPVVLTALAVAGVVAVGVAGDHSGSTVVVKLLAVSPQLGALFVFGLVAAAVTTRSGDSGAGRWWGWAALGALGSAVAACALFGTQRAAGDLYWLDLVLGAAMACCLAFVVRAAGCRTRRAFEWRPLQRIGRFSYSLYLVHAPLLLLAWVYAVDPLDVSSGVKLALMLGLVLPAIVAVSHGFFLMVERPFLEHRSWAELRAVWARRKPAHLARTDGV